MATTFDPDKYFSSGEWKTAVSPEFSYYERLGFKFGDKPSAGEIKDAFQKRYSWWAEKDRKARSGGQAHPTIKIVGHSIPDAIKNLHEAESTLTDPSRKLHYDSEFQDEINKKIEEELVKFIHFALSNDNKISEEEKKNLLNQADVLKITRTRAEEIISSEMEKAGATYKVEKPAMASEAFPNYYEILEISQATNNIEIEEAFKKQYSIWNSRATNPKFRDKVPRMKRLLQDARDTLIDSNRRKEYDRQLLKPPVPPTGGGTPKLEISETSFDFKNIRVGASPSQSFTISNIGGGTLSGPIKTNKKWLTASQNNIDTSKHKQDITFFVDTKGLPFGFKDIGVVEIQSNGGTEKISVNLSVEVPEDALSRFRRSLVPIGAIFGGIFGFIIANFYIDAGTNPLVLIAAGIALIAVSILVGITTESIGAGFATLIGIFIMEGILGSYLPFIAIAIAWALTYSVFAYIIAKPLFIAWHAGNQKAPFVAGGGAIIFTLVLTVGGMATIPSEYKNKKIEQKTHTSEASKNSNFATKKKVKPKKQDAPATAPVSLAGTWDGYFLAHGRKINFELNLNHNGSSISGNINEDGSYRANVEGYIKGNSITFVKNYEGRGFEPVEYVGIINNNKIRGKWIIKKTSSSGEWTATKAR